MSTDYPAQILNLDGTEIEIEGRVNFTDPSNAPGGSQPTTRAIYGGANVSIPNTGAATTLTWDLLISGDALLDLSDPELPTIVTAGVYAVTVQTYPQTAMTDGKAYRMLLTVNGGESDVVTLEQTQAAEDGIDFDLYGFLTITYYLAAGSFLQFDVQQADAGAIDFELTTAVIQRLA